MEVIPRVLKFFLSRKGFWPNNSMGPKNAEIDISIRRLPNEPGLGNGFDSAQFRVSKHGLR